MCFHAFALCFSFFSLFFASHKNGVVHEAPSVGNHGYLS